MVFQHGSSALVVGVVEALLFESMYGLPTLWKDWQMEGPDTDQAEEEVAWSDYSALEAASVVEGVM